MGFLASLFFGFIPMFIFAGILYWLDRYEKEPRILLGVAFLWGAIVSAAAAFITNTVLGVGVYLVTGSEGAANFTTGSIFAPVVEESLKGFAVLLIFLIFRNEFDSILDGIIYAGVVALGFAATENTYYIYSYGFSENGWTGLASMVFIRVILVGWQHPFYTAFTGIGLAFARLSRSCTVKGIAVLIGLGVAILAHSVHNTLAELIGSGGGIFLTSSLDWLGWSLMFIFILIMTGREGKLIAKYLEEEVKLGTMTLSQYKTACSAWAQTGKRISAFFGGSFSQTDKLYKLCGDLAYKKYQLDRVGEESNNHLLVQNLREQIKHLSPIAG